MCFVRAADGEEIGVVRIPQPLDSLVDEDLVHEEVEDSVDEDAQAYPEPRGMQAEHAARDEAAHRRHSEDQEEAVVALDEVVVVLLVVIAVQVPEEAVHHEFMRGPSHELHEGGRAENDGDDGPDAHARGTFGFKLLFAAGPNSASSTAQR